MKALYFSTEEKKLRYGDNRIIVVGETHTVDNKPKCCTIGLHASKRAIDAVSFAPGSILFLVELSGDIDEQEDKLAAQSREYLAEFDATDLLREFARKIALINIEKIKPYCNEESYNLIIHWLKTGDEAVRSAARSAAESAARSANSAAYSAAWSAAEAAAWSAVWSAEESVAWSAANSAAKSAARSAAESAAWSVVWSAANTILSEMLENATGWDLTFSKEVK